MDDEYAQRRGDRDVREPSHAGLSPCGGMTDPGLTPMPPNRSATGCAGRPRRSEPPLAARRHGRRRRHRRPGSPACGRRIALTDTDPALRVVVLEAETVAFGASGRNGGFCEASLTHGLANGIRHFPDELERLEAEGHRQPARADRVHARARDRLRPRGDRRPSPLADQPYQVDEFRAWRDEAAEHGEDARVPRPRRGPRPRSPRRSGRRGCYRPPGQRRPRSTRPRCAGASPASRRERGIAIHEGTQAVTRLERVAGGVQVSHGRRRRRPGRPGRGRDLGLLGLAAPPGRWFVPVYDYVLVSEPLTPGRAGRRSAGPAARACPTPTTSSTTSG